MWAAKTGSDEERLAALGRLLQILDGFAGDKAVPGLGVVGFQHHAAFALLAQNLLSRRLFRGAVLDDIDVPRARVFVFLASVKNLADFDRRVAAVAKMLRQ